MVGPELSIVDRGCLGRPESGDVELCCTVRCASIVLQIKQRGKRVRGEFREKKSLRGVVPDVVVTVVVVRVGQRRVGGPAHKVSVKIK